MVAFNSLSRILILVILYADFSFASVKFFSSTRSIKYLTKIEQKLLPSLYEYSNMLTEHLQTLRQFINEAYNETIVKSNVKRIKVGDEMTIDNDDIVEEISSNPLKILQLFKRFEGPWTKMNNFVQNWSKVNTALKNKTAELQTEMLFPTEDAMTEAMTSMIKLTRKYRIPASSLVHGRLKSLVTNTSLSPEQCYELGRFTLRYQIFPTCIDFLYEGLKLARKKGEKENVNLGNDDKCRKKAKIEEMLESLLQIAIDRHDMKLENGTFEATNNPFHYIEKLENISSPAFKSRIENKLLPDYKNATNTKGLFRAYESVCNGGNLMPKNETKSLVCKLENRRNFVHPYYYIQPLKIEYHHEDPILLQIYDVLTDKEMEEIITTALPRLYRSMVIGNESEGGMAQHVGRTSSNTFFQDYEDGSPFYYINQRIERIVGLKTTILDAAEDIQIANYGPGEFYAPHYDGGEREEEMAKLIPFHNFRGDRLATFMIYLNDGFLGGSTAFPRLGISVRPVKGSGVFWFNLRHDGSIQKLSLHAGCAVIHGEKWIANKWIRVNEQMFIRKCQLTPPPKQE